MRDASAAGPGRTRAANAKNDAFTAGSGAATVTATTRTLAAGRGRGATTSPAEAPSNSQPVLVQTGFGELQIAASTDGKNVLLATQNGNSVSSNGGVSYKPSAFPPFPFTTRGDPSVGVGASGDFYLATLGLPLTDCQPYVDALNTARQILRAVLNNPDHTPAEFKAAEQAVTIAENILGFCRANPSFGCSVPVARSTDNSGKTFTFTGTAKLCPIGANTCLPDQEQMAVDRTNSSSSGDQLYVVWRNFPAPSGVTQCLNIFGGRPAPIISCSKDSGQTWGNQTPVGTAGDDIGRITVGPDGSAYVTYVSGSNLMIDKFSSCANGLVRQSQFPHRFASFTGTPCPIPGLNRCGTNTEASPQPAVDDTNPQNVLVAYADNTGDGNDDVVVRRSRDGGVTWPDVNIANAKVTGRRFLPWICVSNGTAHVTWYDRRTATSSNNSLTTYYWSAGFPRLLGESGQFSGAETNVSGAADPECASGFPSPGPDNFNDATSCQPPPTSVPGVCITGTGGGSGSACNTLSPVCPKGEKCNPPALAGAPKYGDYNGNACAAGKVYMAWASAVPPPGITPAPPSGINVYAATGSPAPPCMPKISCDRGAQCGIQDDGCGGTLGYGGTCPSGSVCDNEINRCSSGCEAICVHQWEACKDCEGRDCTAKSVCLSTFHSCEATLKPKTCAELGQQCGPANDGCGHTIDCGGCSGNSSCSGGRWS